MTIYLLSISDLFPELQSVEDPKIKEKSADMTHNFETSQTLNKDSLDSWTILSPNTLF